MAELRKTVSKHEVLAAIPNSKGLIEPLEKALFCTRNAIKQILNDCPEVKEALAEELEREKDRIEFNLMLDAAAGDPKARELFMKSRMRERHYGERLEVTGAEGAPLVFLHATAADVGIDVWTQKAKDYDAQQAKALDAELFEAARLANSASAEKALPDSISAPIAKQRHRPAAKKSGK